MHGYTYSNSGNNNLRLDRTTNMDLVRPVLQENQEAPPMFGWQPLCLSSRREAVARVRQHCRTTGEKDFINYLSEAGTNEADTALRYLDAIVGRVAGDLGRAVVEMQRQVERRSAATQNYEADVEGMHKLAEQARAERDEANDYADSVSEANTHLNEQLERAEREIAALRQPDNLTTGTEVFEKITGNGPYILVQPTTMVVDAVSDPVNQTRERAVLEDAWLLHTKKGTSVRLPRAVLTTERPRRLLTRVLTSPATASALFGVMIGCLVYNILG